MIKSRDAQRRDERQARVAKVVWGLVFIGMGTLFAMAEAGRLEVADKGRFQPANAVDGRPDTRWSSAFKERQWLSIDLGEPIEVTRVRLNWEAAYAKNYRIELSNDGTTWTTAKEVTDAKGGVEDLEVGATGRYLRLASVKRGTPYGVSLWEMEIYSPSGLVSAGKPATASSREKNGPWNLVWAFWWPVLIVAIGLPALLAPKDGGDQVWGLVLTTAGVFLQLRNFGAVSLGIHQAWPLLLILAGVALLLQSLRKGDKTEPRGDDPKPEDQNPAAPSNPSNPV